MPSDDLIDAFLISLRERSLSEVTIKGYKWQLRNADKHIEKGLDGTTEAGLKAWIWRGDYAPATRLACYAALTGFYRWAVEADVFEFDPTARIAAPRVGHGLPRVASDEQVKWALTESAEPYRLWANLAAYGGLRCIEIWRLHREHVTAEQIRVHGKGNKYRLIPTHPVVWAAVEQLPAGPLTHLPTQGSVSSGFVHFCQRQGVNGLSLHRLRGWFATTTYNLSHDARAVQELLGHSSLATTTRYIAVGEQQRRALVTALPVFSDVPVGAPAKRRRRAAA